MSISPKCDKCQKQLNDFGAILFSPPDTKSKVLKFHICKDCYRELVKKLKI